MDWYLVAFFVHMIGVIGVFGGQILLQHTGAKLRLANTWQEVRLWMGLVTSGPMMMTGGSVLLLLSGLYMTWNRWSFSTPWASIGILVVIAFPILGIAHSKPRFEAIGREAAQSEGPLSAEGRAKIQSPDLWMLPMAMGFAVMGLVAMMVFKPGWLGSVLTMLAFGVVGAWIGRSSTLAAAKATAATAKP